MDFARYKTNKQLAHKCFVEVGNKLPNYSNLVNRGLITLKADSKKQITLVVTDSWNNKSEIKISATGEAANATISAEESKMDWKSDHTIKVDGVKIHIPGGTLYKDENISLSTKAACAKCETSIYSIGNKTIPAQNRMTLSIHKDQLSKKEKLVWAAMNGNGNGSGLTTKWDGDWLFAHPKEFGDYAIMEDKAAPTINVSNFANGKIVKRGSKISMTATDYLSGITFYEATIDDKWALLQHDAKRNYFWHDFEDSLTPGSHVITLTFKDEVGNIATFQSVFTYQP